LTSSEKKNSSLITDIFLDVLGVFECENTAQIEIKKNQLKVQILGLKPHCFLFTCVKPYI